MNEYPEGWRQAFLWSVWPGAAYWQLPAELPEYLQYLMLQFFLKTLPKSKAVGEDGKPRTRLPTRQEATPLSWACSAVAEGHLFPDFLFRFRYCSISLSPFYLMGPYIKTCYITLLFCYGTFKWESFSKPSCLAIKCVKSIS